MLCIKYKNNGKNCNNGIHSSMTASIHLATAVKFCDSVEYIDITQTFVLCLSMVEYIGTFYCA